jgi:hypothetical protein
MKQSDNLPTALQQRAFLMRVRLGLLNLAGGVEVEAGLTILLTFERFDFALTHCTVLN